MTRSIVVAVAVLLGSGLGAAQSLPEWAAPRVPPAEWGQPLFAPPTLPGPMPSQVPIDGGLGLLALAGGAYAIRRLRKE